MAHRKRGERKRVLTYNSKPSLTKQADKKYACIHNILDKYKRTGLLPQRTVEPLEGSLPLVDDFQTAMDMIIESQKSFDSLPSDIRSKFDNSPKKFIEFVSNDENKPAMEKMGLLKDKTPKKPPEVFVTNLATPPCI